MSDKKMIIRNCPAFDSKYNECHSKIEPHRLYCMDCTDCVMKQIYEICKDNALIGDIDETAEKVVDLLDIQEVE